MISFKMFTDVRVRLLEPWLTVQFYTHNSFETVCKILFLLLFRVVFAHWIWKITWEITRKVKSLWVISQFYPTHFDEKVGIIIWKLHRCNNCTNKNDFANLKYEIIVIRTLFEYFQFLILCSLPWIYLPFLYIFFATFPLMYWPNSPFPFFSYI